MEDRIARAMALDAEEKASGSYTKAETDALLGTKADLVNGKVPASELPCYTKTEVDTSVNSLQAQINQIEIASAEEYVVAPEVAAARVDADGTEYSTLKQRLDKNDIVDTELTVITGYEKVNLLNNTLSTTTSNGVTFTVNADKTITVNGTATANAFVGMNITLPAGEYFLTGAPKGSTAATYHLICSPNVAPLYDVGNGTTISLSEQKTFAIYVRVMNGKTVNNVTFLPMVQKKPVSNPTYVPYGEFQIYKPIQKLIDYTVFNWSGKKINVIGDSIVLGSYGNFVNVIGQILNLSTVRNYGVGGSHLASSSVDQQYPPVVTRYVDMDDDADIVLVHAGTNDYSGQIPLGDDDSTDVTTFNGALNVMMTGLREKYPTALIIFDSILHRYNDGELTIKAREYRQAIENRCLANHIVFYDCYKYSGFDFVKGYYDHILTVDGLHPNQAGANILGRKIAGFIRWN